MKIFKLLFAIAVIAILASCTNSDAAVSRSKIVPGQTPQKKVVITYQILTPFNSYTVSKYTKDSVGDLFFIARVQVNSCGCKDKFENRPTTVHGSYVIQTIKTEE